MAKHRFERFEEAGAARSELASEVAASCKLVKLYYFVEGRNAWHATWSVKYLASSSFRVDFDQAKYGVEPYRTQGSTWTIRELPAIVFISQKYCLAVTEINTKQPLSGFTADEIISDSRTLFRIAERFWTWRPNSVIRLVSPPQDFEQLDGELRCYTSHSRGGGVLLRWKPIRDPLNRYEIYVEHMEKLSSTCAELIESPSAVARNSTAFYEPADVQPQD